MNNIKNLIHYITNFIISGFKYLIQRLYNKIITQELAEKLALSIILKIKRLFKLNLVLGQNMILSRT